MYSCPALNGHCDYYQTNEKKNHLEIMYDGWDGAFVVRNNIGTINNNNYNDSKNNCNSNQWQGRTNHHHNNYNILGDFNWIITITSFGVNCKP